MKHLKAQTMGDYSENVFVAITKSVCREKKREGFMREEETEQWNRTNNQLTIVTYHETRVVIMEIVKEKEGLPSAVIHQHDETRAVLNTLKEKKTFWSKESETTINEMRQWQEEPKTYHQARNKKDVTNFGETVCFTTADRNQLAKVERLVNKMTKLK